MKHTNKQIRLCKLALLLGGGKEVKTEAVMAELGCSVATLTRTLRELQTDFNAVISYKKSTESYQLTERGQLMPADLARMKRLVDNNQPKNDNSVVITKPAKKSFSASIDYKLLKRLNSLASQKNISRSEVLEVLISKFGVIDNLVEC